MDGMSCVLIIFVSLCFLCPSEGVLQTAAAAAAEVPLRARWRDDGGGSSGRMFKKTGEITISVDVKNERGLRGWRQKRLIDCRKRLKILS